VEEISTSNIIWFGQYHCPKSNKTYATGIS